MTVLLNFQRSSLIANGTTGPISAATAVELVVIIVVLLLCVVFLNLTGVVAASIAFIAGKGLSNLFLLLEISPSPFLNPAGVIHFVH